NERSIALPRYATHGWTAARNPPWLHRPCRERPGQPVETTALIESRKRSAVPGFPPVGTDSVHGGGADDGLTCVRLLAGGQQTSGGDPQSWMTSLALQRPAPEESDELPIDLCHLGWA